MKLRLVINAIALGYTSFMFANNLTTPLFAYMAACFAVTIFGCVLSTIDYIKEEKND